MSEEKLVFNSKDAVSLIDSGEYECTIDKVELGKSKNDNDIVKLQYRIRVDIEQNAQNRIIFETIGLRSEFFKKRAGGLLKCLGATNKDFLISEFIDFVSGKPILIKLGQRVSNYTGDEENYIQYISSSRHPNQTLSDTPIVEGEDVLPDDLPF